MRLNGSTWLTFQACYVTRQSCCGVILSISYRAVVTDVTVLCNQLTCGKQYNITVAFTSQNDVTITSVWQVSVYKNCVFYSAATTDGRMAKPLQCAFAYRKALTYQKDERVASLVSDITKKSVHCGTST